MLVGRPSYLLLYEQALEKLAFCSIYLACNSGRRPQHEDENTDLLGLVGTEIEHLRAQGFQILILGDLNSWTGEEGRYGIPGSRRDINFNGQLLSDFLMSKDLDIANKTLVAQGLFTRFPFNGVGLPTVLDLVCTDRQIIDRVAEFSVDENNAHEIRSDHRY